MSTFLVEVDITASTPWAPSPLSLWILADQFEPSNPYEANVLTTAYDPLLPPGDFVITNVIYFDPPPAMLAAVVPEPATWVLMLVGLCHVAAKSIRKRAQSRADRRALGAALSGARP